MRWVGLSDSPSGLGRLFFLAEAEARGLGFSYVGTESLLLGLLRELEGAAARALEMFDVGLQRAREGDLQRVAPGDALPASAQMPFTARAKQVLERARQEALALGHTYVGTEHILLALASVDEGEAMNVLRGFGVDSEHIRKAVIKPLSSQVRPLAPRSRVRGDRLRTARVTVSAEPPLQGGSRVARRRRGAAGRTRRDHGPRSVDRALRGERTGAALAQLGASETAIRAALERGTGQPPEAPAGS